MFGVIKVLANTITLNEQVYIFSVVVFCPFFPLVILLLFALP